MKFENNYGFEQVFKDLEKALNEEKIVMFVLDRTRSNIREQLDQGMGMDKPLAKYSTKAPSYLEKRVGSGRSARPNLQWTSEMVKFMTIRWLNGVGELIFSGGTSKSKYLTKNQKAAIKKQEKKSGSHLLPSRYQQVNRFGEISNAAKAFYNQKLRPFVGLGAKSAERVEAELARFVSKLFKSGG